MAAARAPQPYLAYRADEGEHVQEVQHADLPRERTTKQDKRRKKGKHYRSKQEGKHREHPPAATSTNGSRHRRHRPQKDPCGLPTNLLQVGVYVGVPGREHVDRGPDLDDVPALGQEGQVQVPHLWCNCAALACRGADDRRDRKKWRICPLLRRCYGTGCYVACALLELAVGLRSLLRGPEQLATPFEAACYDTGTHFLKRAHAITTSTAVLHNTIAYASAKAAEERSP